MLLALIVTVIGSIFLSVWASSLLWKYAKHTWTGFMTAGSMALIGILMMVVFDTWRPAFLTLAQYILVLYGVCLLYFTVQLAIVLKSTKIRRLSNVNI